MTFEGAEPFTIAGTAVFVLLLTLGCVVQGSFVSVRLAGTLAHTEHSLGRPWRH